MKKLIIFLLILIALPVVAVMVGYHLYPEKMLAAAIQAERDQAGLTARTVKVGKYEMHYLEGGPDNPHGSPLVLVHGFNADKSNWRVIARHLTPHYRVIIPDLLGFGESSKPLDVPYGYSNQVEYLRAFLQALGVDFVHLAGNSMGGGISGTYAALYPQEVESVWLLAPAGVRDVGRTNEFVAQLETGNNVLIPKTRDEFRQIMDWVFVEPPFAPDKFVDIVADQKIANHQVNTKVFADLAADPIWLQDVADRIQAPTLILWGDQDRLLDVSAAQVLHQLIPDSKLLIYKNVGHAPMMETPARAAKDYLEFRSGLQPG